jgi:hypothetical protein
LKDGLAPASGAFGAIGGCGVRVRVKVRVRVRLGVAARVAD